MAAPAEEVFDDTLWMTVDCLFDNALGNALAGRAVFGEVYRQQDWRSTEEYGLGDFMDFMRISGHWATVCDHVQALRAKCRDGALKGAVQTALPEGKRLVLHNGATSRRLTIRKHGSGKTRFKHPTADGKVRVEDCSQWKEWSRCR